MFKLHWVFGTVTIGSAACWCLQSPLIGQYGLCAHMNACFDKRQQPKITFSHRCTDVCVQCLILKKCDQKPVWGWWKQETHVGPNQRDKWWLNNGTWSLHKHAHSHIHTHTQLAYASHFFFFLHFVSISFLSPRSDFSPDKPSWWSSS